MERPILEITNRCIYCDNCLLLCPEHAIIKVNEYIIDYTSCTLCSICQSVCPVDCIKLVIQEGGSAR